MSQTPTPFGLRLPPKMRQWITERAKWNRRSINGEIIHLLGRVLENDERGGVDHGQG